MLFVPEQELCSLQSTLSVPLRIDLMQQRVWIAGEPLHVSRKEFIFLHLLQQWRERGEPCPRRLLCQMVYANEVALPHDREARLDCMVARLRQKLKQIADQPVEIKTTWEVGLPTALLFRIFLVIIIYLKLSKGDKASLFWSAPQDFSSTARNDNSGRVECHIKDRHLSLPDLVKFAYALFTL